MPYLALASIFGVDASSVILASEGLQFLAVRAQHFLAFGSVDLELVVLRSVALAASASV